MIGGFFAFVLVVAVGSGLGGGAETTPTAEVGSTDSTEAQASQDEEASAGIGDAVRDGKFEFTADGVDCGETTIGDAEFLSTDAQGQFCIVDLSVTNIGDEPQSFFGDGQYMFDADGKKYSADGEAAIYLDESDSLLEEINPGNSVAAKVVFDVPTSVVPAMIELHDSSFSDGVEVALS